MTKFCKDCVHCVDSYTVVGCLYMAFSIPIYACKALQHTGKTSLVTGLEILDYDKEQECDKARKGFCGEKGEFYHSKHG